MSTERNSRPVLRTPRSALRTRAFTLIEMLTVIAIIGILAGILIPVVSAAMRRARVVEATADVSKLYQAATTYNLDFGAFPPDCTAFWTSPNPAEPQADNPFPGYWIPVASLQQMPLNPNELLTWYLSMQYSSGQYSTVTHSYPAAGYPEDYPAAVPWKPLPLPGLYGWIPSSASVVFARGSNANSGPYFDLKAKQKTDVNKNGYYEFMDPWGRPYMYRAYPQTVVNGATVDKVSSDGKTVRLTLTDLTPPSTAPNPPYAINYFNTNSGLSNTVGSIQLSGFTNAGFNGTYTFPAVNGPADLLPVGDNQVTVTTGSLPNVGDFGPVRFPAPQQAELRHLQPGSVRAHSRRRFDAERRCAPQSPGMEAHAWRRERLARPHFPGRMEPGLGHARRRQRH